LLIRYEDLLSEPETISQKNITFLESHSKEPGKKIVPMQPAPETCNTANSKMASRRKRIPWIFSGLGRRISGHKTTRGSSRW